MAVLAGTPARVAQTQDSCPLGQFLAQYYDHEGRLVFTACEARIEHDWGLGKARKPDVGDKPDAPGSLSVGPDHFRVTWTGRFRFADGIYTFIAIADDGMRVKLDGELIINEWRVQPATEFRVQKRLAGGVHAVEVEYYEEAEAAVAKLRWERAAP